MPVKSFHYLFEVFYRFDFFSNAWFSRGESVDHHKLPIGAYVVPNKIVTEYTIKLTCRKLFEVQEKWTNYYRKRVLMKRISFSSGAILGWPWKLASWEQAFNKCWSTTKSFLQLNFAVQVHAFSVTSSSELNCVWTTILFGSIFKHFFVGFNYCFSHKKSFVTFFDRLRVDPMTHFTRTRHSGQFALVFEDADY